MLACIFTLDLKLVWLQPKPSLARTGSVGGSQVFFGRKTEDLSVLIAIFSHEDCSVKKEIARIRTYYCIESLEFPLLFVLVNGEYSYQKVSWKCKSFTSACEWRRSLPSFWWHFVWERSVACSLKRCRQPREMSEIIKHFVGKLQTNSVALRLNMYCAALNSVPDSIEKWRDAPEHPVELFFASALDDYDSVWKQERKLFSEYNIWQRKVDSERALRISSLTEQTRVISKRPS